MSGGSSAPAGTAAGRRPAAHAPLTAGPGSQRAGSTSRSRSVSCSMYVPVTWFGSRYTSTFPITAGHVVSSQK